MAAASLVQAGGPALNAAITYSFLGGDATLISATGQTSLSKIIEEELLQYDVRFVNRQSSAQVQPPLSSIILNTNLGTRTIFNAPGTGLEQDWSSQPTSLADMLLLDGFYLAQLRGVIEEFAAAGKPICLDGGTWRSDTDDLLPLLSVAICSEGFSPPGTRSPAEVLAYLHDRGVALGAVTRGSHTIVGSDRGRLFELPVAKGEAIDTLGAGDIFHGAFCWYHLGGLAFEEALHKASAVATCSCQSLGTRQWMRSFAKECV